MVNGLFSLTLNSFFHGMICDLGLRVTKPDSFQLVVPIKMLQAVLYTFLCICCTSQVRS